MQTLLSFAYLDDRDGHLTFVHGLRTLRVSLQMLLSFAYAGERAWPDWRIAGTSSALCGGAKTEYRFTTTTTTTATTATTVTTTTTTTKQSMAAKQSKA